MKVKALRGVCIGVDRHLKPDDVVDLEPALVTFLTNIGAVERVPDPPPAAVKAEPKPEPEIKSVPNKDGKKEK